VKNANMHSNQEYVFELKLISIKLKINLFL